MSSAFNSLPETVGVSQYYENTKAHSARVIFGCHFIDLCKHGHSTVRIGDECFFTGTKSIM